MRATPRWAPLASLAFAACLGGACSGVFAFDDACGADADCPGDALCSDEFLCVEPDHESAEDDEGTGDTPPGDGFVLETAISSAASAPRVPPRTESRTANPAD